MEKRFDILALGELLIDFNEIGNGEQGSPILEANPGGAPCNVLAMMQKLGRRTAFLGKVGRDPFGNQLEMAISSVGISCKGLLRDPDVHTTLAFVHNLEDGDREFSFYRNPGADMMLSEQDVMENAGLIADARIFHFGTLSMTHPGCREATKMALKIAAEKGCLISFDPNLREPLWNSLEEAEEQTLYGISKCDILKISDNEIDWIMDQPLGSATEEEFLSHYQSLAGKLLEKFPNVSLIMVSLGKEGSLADNGKEIAFCPGILNPDTIDTTGAGDTFVGCVLDSLLTLTEDARAGEMEAVHIRNQIQTLSKGELVSILQRANAAASLITTKKGALMSMPDPEQIANVLETMKP